MCSRELIYINLDTHIMRLPCHVQLCLKFECQKKWLNACKSTKYINTISVMPMSVLSYLNFLILKSIPL